MSGASNAVWAPIRRWVLYSRTNLTITVVVILASLMVIGNIVGEPLGAKAKTPATDPRLADAGTVRPISFEIVEVNASGVAGRSPSWVVSSAPSTAMAYAVAYLDRELSKTQWLAKLGKFTAETPGEEFVKQRLTKPVAVTGPTKSVMAGGDAPAKQATVKVPTSAGALTVTVKVVTAASGARAWAVTTPLPALDPAAVAGLSGPGSTGGASPSTTSAPSTTVPSLVPGAPEPRPVTGSSTTPSSSAPTPIPAPQLDTPLPGGA